ncbi:5'/3'-nucleotidase SurE [Candidatus Sulfidibacterium hydrothermale]|uniref:5'/3'-nucleotidase SurE n=1 Tax=Candidatus Sulfidibacterium hydrothermale TaxID=2875962 RepID=UPI001F0B4B5A|nr:5'/3'-nucleotidase SurE [Candidatus Sulfidibacterium hydrothermale]UBM61484.1 5'/3'-nucleotidase SurE [Candidatus Sulfidibacterium hydrothermale]
MQKKPLILITNDDSIHAKGLRKLIELMRDFGDVVVISSEQVMSGMSHAVTIKTPLMPRLIHEEKGFKEYLTNGTPVDNIKLGKHALLNQKPDLIVSGINHGSNAAINIVYSGTMAAAMEGAIDGIPSIGFSVDDYDHEADFSHVDPFVNTITRKVLDEGLPEGVCLNVNIPKKSEEPVKGIKVVRQAKARWIEDFDARVDPFGRTYYWIGGTFVNGDPRPDTDEKALSENYVAVTPVQIDFTATQWLKQLKF